MVLANPLTQRQRPRHGVFLSEGVANILTSDYICSHCKGAGIALKDSLIHPHNLSENDMPTTHLALMTQPKCPAPVTEEQVKVGLVVNYPSGLGGAFTLKCVHKDAEKAVFKNIDKDWPTTVVARFSVPEFTLADFEQLEVALRMFSMMSCSPTDEQRAVARRAHELGYARLRSYTQAEWTTAGVELYKSLQASRT